MYTAEPTQNAPDIMSPMQMDDSVTDEQLQADLNAKFAHVTGKRSALDEQMEIQSKGLEGSRKAAVEKLFAELRKMGVDPSDPTSMSNFLQNLQQTNPEMFDLLVKILDYIQHDPAGTAEGAQEELSPGFLPSAMPEVAPENAPMGMPTEMQPGMPAGMPMGAPPEISGGMPPEMQMPQ